MNLVEEAIIFATEKHGGQIRKMANTPYILHPVEVASIIATVTDSYETMAAGILHDTIEDCGVELSEIRDKFGPRVAALVASETEDRLGNRKPEDSWMARKEESLLMLRNTKDRDVKILWLGDKLSNMRSFAREYEKHGNAIFENLHQKDPAVQGWYYKTIAKDLEELKDTFAYKEYVALVEKVFGEIKEEI